MLYIHMYIALYNSYSLDHVSLYTFEPYQPINAALYKPSILNPKLLPRWCYQAEAAEGLCVEMLQAERLRGKQRISAETLLFRTADPLVAQGKSALPLPGRLETLMTYWREKTKSQKTNLVRRWCTEQEMIKLGCPECFC